MEIEEYIESKVVLNGDDGEHLMCPNCGYDYLHTDGSTYVDKSYGGYDISMYCEGCPADIILRVLSHKGMTYVRMYHLPHGRASERRADYWKSNSGKQTNG